ncbi:phosphotransferase enzyme family protein [Actinomycetes bacterium NPDC127524]
MDILNQICEKYGVNRTYLVAINDGLQNSIFSYRKDEKEYILRISNSNRRSVEQLQSELTFIEGLAKSGLPVSKPVLSANLRLVEEINEQNSTFFTVAFTKAKGKPINVTDSSVWNEDLFFRWGKFIGKMHNLSGRFKGLQRPEWTVANPDLLNLLPKINTDIVKKRYLQLLDKLSHYQKSPDLFGLIHNDFHQGNFFFDNGEMTVFDFDDCAYNWFAYDLAVSFYHAYWQASSFTQDNINFSNIFWANFLRGYTSERTMTKELIEQVPIFLKIREIFLYVLFLEKWDLVHLEDWQAYTLKDLNYKIDNKIPYSYTDFQEISIQY